MNKFRYSTLALATAASLALAACSGASPEAAPPENGLDEGVIIENALDAPLVNAELPPEPTATPTSTPEDTKAVETQMQEDADATGMTARVDRSEPQDVPVDDAAKQE